MPPGTRIVVLGGSGFVGSAIVSALLRAHYHPVSAQRRPRRDVGPIEQVICDATNPASVLRALRGAGAVVNAVLGDADTMMAATSAVAGAAATTGPPIVHLSSMAVYGAARGLIDESAPLRGTGGYAEAKIECESMLAGTGAVILRPGIIYGPGGEQWAGRIFRLLRAGRLGDLGENGDGRCNFAHARDVAAAVVAALGAPAARGRAINIAHHRAPRWNKVLTACARAIGAVPVRRIGPRALSADCRVLGPPLYLARLAAARAGLRCLYLPDPITPSLCALFKQDFVLDTRLATRLLGITPVLPAEGLAECAHWFRDTHGISSSMRLS